MLLEIAGQKHYYFFLLLLVLSLNVEFDVGPSAAIPLNDQFKFELEEVVDFS